VNVSLILDTDIGSDVDDALALAFALRHPDIDLKAVTTVSGDTVRRARIAKKLLLLAGRDDIEVAAGERGEQSNPQRSAEGGHEDAMLGDDARDLPIAERDGVSLLLEECAAHHYEVATVGMQSNVAAALDSDPSFADDVARLTVMGGVFAPVRFLDHELPPGIDHNLNVDQQASLRALNAGMTTLYIGCDVTMGTWMTAKQLEALRGGDPLCRELARQIDVFTPGWRASGRGAIPEEYVALLHDPFAVACTVDRRFVTSMHARVTVAMHQGFVRTFIDPAAGHEAEIITAVDWRAFGEFCLDTILRGR
jgi:inosine-uridine nucleoside N-ribohydrolase